GFDPNTNQFLSDFGNPYALAMDVDNGLLIAERGGQKIQRITPNPNKGFVDPFSYRLNTVTDILTNRQLPLQNVAPFSPVGITRVPGLLLAADDYSRIVWGTSRPPILGTCPSGASCA